MQYSENGMFIVCENRFVFSVEIFEFSLPNTGEHFIPGVEKKKPLVS